MAAPIPEAACRLYLISPPELDPGGFVATLADALGAGDVACFQLALADADDDAWRRACGVLVPVCREHDVAFLLNGHVSLVAETGADGVHIQGEIEGLRAGLPEDAILGAGCGLSRHAAMVAGEAGADYVSFGPWGPEAADLLCWWQELMELPCVAAGGIGLEEVAAAAAAGADFVALRGAVWSYEQGAPAAVAKAFDSVANPPPRC